MDIPSDQVPARRAALSEVLKALRKHRGQKASEVAGVMKMPLRSYEHFEAGGGRPNLERIHQFADALGADAFAIFAAVDIGSPAFATRCANNKLMTILMMSLRDFDATARDDITRLDARTLIGAFTEFFETLATRAREQGEFVEQWMAEKPLRGPDTDQD